MSQSEGKHAAVKNSSARAASKAFVILSSFALVLITFLAGVSPITTDATDESFSVAGLTLEGVPVSTPVIVPADAGGLEFGALDFSVSLTKTPVTGIPELVAAKAVREEATRQIAEQEQSSVSYAESSGAGTNSGSASSGASRFSSGAGGSASTDNASPSATSSSDKNAPLGSGQRLTFYMSPNGNNSNKGTDTSSPIANFSGVQQLINNNPHSNIDLVVLGGQYSVGDNELSVALNGNRLRIRGEGNPVFSGGGGAKMYWLDILVRDGSPVQVEGITVKNYANGLRIGGGYDYKKTGQAARGVYAAVNTPVVKNMRFENIGDRHSSGSGYAAVHLQNVSRPYVLNNTFSNITNSAQRASYIHAVYAVLSKDTKIRGNDFSGVSGDPVRFRHASSGEVSGNSFRNAGKAAHVSDWFCDVACAKRSAQSYECPSQNISISNNRLGGLREWTRTIKPAGAWSGC